MFLIAALRQLDLALALPQTFFLLVVFTIVAIGATDPLHKKTRNFFMMLPQDKRIEIILAGVAGAADSGNDCA